MKSLFEGILICLHIQRDVRMPDLVDDIDEPRVSKPVHRFPVLHQLRAVPDFQPLELPVSVLSGQLRGTEF